MGWRHETVSLAGPAYIDYLHGQMGVAPNGIEIHPVLAMCFGKGCALPPIRPAPAGAPVARATRRVPACTASW